MNAFGRIRELQSSVDVSQQRYLRIAVNYQNTAFMFELQDADSLYLEKLSINQQIYNSPQHRLNMRDPPYGMVELRMLLLTVVNALKRNPVRQEQWFTFILRILPFLDRYVACLQGKLVHSTASSTFYTHWHTWCRNICQII